MRTGVAVVVGAICLVSCAPGAAGGPASPAPGAPPAAAATKALLPYYGSYSAAGGEIFVIARLGWFFDMRDSAYRTIYATASPNHFTIGSRFQEPLPKFADLLFSAGTLTLTDSTRNVTARRIAYKQTDVSIPAQGALLAATITEPAGSSPHPGIVIVHGSERGQRFFYDVWVGVYTSMGLAVLTYDKRGNGSSTGTYPGEFPTEAALRIYAADAAAVLSFLAHRPGIDPKRVGFHGGSQGGWTVPLAIQVHPEAAFAVLASAPATTVDQTDLWSSFSNGGETMPSESTDQMLASVRSTHSGYDPASALRAMAVPALWLSGVNDRTVPTAVCVEILTTLHKPDFTVRLLPTGHGLLVNPTGLLADDARSPGLASEMLLALRDWMAQVMSG